MIIIYHAANSMDAHLIKNLLEQHNIPAFVLGEFLQGGIGDLPASDFIKVAIDAQYQAAAKDAIQQWESATIMKTEEDFNPSGDAAHGVI